MINDILPQVDISQLRSKRVIIEEPFVQELSKGQITRKANILEKNEQVSSLNPVIGAVELLDRPKKSTRKQRVNQIKDAIVTAFLGEEEDERGVDRFIAYVEALKISKPQIATKLLEKVMDEKEDLTVINTQAPIVILSSSEFSQKLLPLGDEYASSGSISEGEAG